MQCTINSVLIARTNGVVCGSAEARTHAGHDRRSPTERDWGVPSKTGRGGIPLRPLFSACFGELCPSSVLCFNSGLQSGQPVPTIGSLGVKVGRMPDLITDVE